MEIVLFAAGALAALSGFAHHNPPRSSGAVDPYTAWLLRHEKPALHR